nr:peptidase C48, SUMO/sentrin/Ubl1 [Tanacetum cinerariifolium]
DMLGIKNERVDILEGNPNRDDEMVRNWKQQYGDAKEITTADVKMRMRKSEEADLNFKLNFIVLFTSIMGNIHQKGYMNSLKCSSEGNNSSTNAMMPDTQEKEKDVQGEASYPNMNRVEVLNEEVEVLNGDIGVNEQTPSSGKDLMGLTKNMWDKTLMWDKTHALYSDKVELSIEKSKSMEVDDRPSFSFGVTQDFDVIEVTKNENKGLTPMPISVYKSGVKASDVFMFRGKKGD